MALTEFQRTVCRLISKQRIESGESYIAGAVALNELTNAPRVSRDIDLFHDTTEAVTASWEADRRHLEANGYRITTEHERTGFVEAMVGKEGESVLMQWAADSAFRFFPLVKHEDFGLTLHPFDLATNKVLALVGRLEVRDWIDVIHCNERVQPLGYLAWAASGKDPGFSPVSILEEAARANRHSRVEIEKLDFEGEPPDAGALSRRWHEILGEARSAVPLLPPAEVGKGVLDKQGELFTGDADELRSALETQSLRFHEGRIHGALPVINGN